MKNNKGQLSILTTLIVTLIVVGVILTTGWLIDDQIQEQIGLVNYQITNETGAFMNNSGYTLAVASQPGASNFVITELTNATGDDVPSNYTVNVNGVLKNSTNDQTNALNDATMNVSYTYDVGEEGWKGIENHADSMTTISDFLPLVILVVIIGIVLLILFGVIPTGRSSMMGA